MKNCKSCGNRIAKTAEACPKCGRPNRQRTSTGSLIVGLLLVVIVAAMFAARM